MITFAYERGIRNEDGTGMSYDQYKRESAEGLKNGRLEILNTPYQPVEDEAYPGESFYPSICTLEEDPEKKILYALKVQCHVHGFDFVIEHASDEIKKQILDMKFDDEFVDVVGVWIALMKNDDFKVALFSKLSAEQQKEVVFLMEHNKTEDYEFYKNF